MAFVGATIVFMGLVVLSFVISQIHKILNLWDKRDDWLARPKGEQRAAEAQSGASPVYRERRLPNVDELVIIYRPLIERLKQPFDLVQLYELSNQMDLPHPNLSINRLRDAKILIAQGNGKFTWNR